MVNVYEVAPWGPPRKEIPPYEPPPEVAPVEPVIDPRIEAYASGLAEYLYSMESAGVIDRGTVAYTDDKDVFHPATGSARITEIAQEQLSTSGISPNLPFFEQASKGQTYADVINRWAATQGGGYNEFAKAKARIVGNPAMTYNEQRSALGRLLNTNEWAQANYMSASQSIETDIFARFPEELRAETERVEAGRITPRYRAPATGYGVTPTPQYRPAYEAAGMGSQPYRDWFERQYSAELSRYREGVETPTEESWATYLKKREPQLREEWAGLSPWERGERPSYFAPAIKTVQF